MTVRFVIDMNLSPSWTATFATAGHQAVHWSATGDARATDKAIMQWAEANNHIVVTHDLDFTTILAATRATRPSVVLLRGQDTLPERMGPPVLSAIHSHLASLLAGAIVVVDIINSRIRILPLN